MKKGKKITQAKSAKQGVKVQNSYTPSGLLSFADLKEPKNTYIDFVLGLLTTGVFFVLLLNLLKTDVSVAQSFFTATSSTISSTLNHFFPVKENVKVLAPACVVVSQTKTPLNQAPQKIKIEKGDNYWTIATRICNNANLYEYLYRLNNGIDLHEGDLIDVRCDGR